MHWTYMGHDSLENTAPTGPTLHPGIEYPPFPPPGRRGLCTLGYITSHIVTASLSCQFSVKKDYPKERASHPLFTVLGVAVGAGK